MIREKSTGRLVRVHEGRARVLKPHQEIIEVWEKDPTVQAFSDPMNRALDKPKEQEQEIKLTGSVDDVSILRRRFAKRQQAEATAGEQVK